jgi:hypothetical protein
LFGNDSFARKFSFDLSQSLVDMIPRVFIQFQTGGQLPQLPINSAAEFMAICALIQAPGRLIFDNVQETLEKVMP